MAVRNPDGNWSFDAASYDSLPEGEQLVLTIPYTVTDEHGATSAADLTVTITGTTVLRAAAFKSGLLTGEWSDRRYRRIAIGCLAALAAPGFVVRGRGVAASLDSASHGAGAPRSWASRQASCTSSRKKSSPATSRTPRT